MFFGNIISHFCCETNSFILPWPKRIKCTSLLIIMRYWSIMKISKINKRCIFLSNGKFNESLLNKLIFQLFEHLYNSRTMEMFLLKQDWYLHKKMTYIWSSLALYCNSSYQCKYVLALDILMSSFLMIVIVVSLWFFG